MNIIISNKSGVPIYEQIACSIKEEIANKRLKKDEILPSIRSLAKELRISVITTKKAYEELERDGYVYTVRGKGIFVADTNLEFIKDDKLREIEKELINIIRECKNIGITYLDFKDMSKILWNEG